LEIGKLGIGLSVLFTRLDTWLLCQWGEGGGKGAMTEEEEERKNSWIPRTNRNQIRRKRIIDNGRHICT
jgi:hypothetical protein